VLSKVMEPATPSIVITGCRDLGPRELPGLHSKIGKGTDFVVLFSGEPQ
jgi:hypothetical protein